MRPTRRYKFLVAVFIVLYLTPNIVALLSAQEDWPYTSAPMFAHYVSEETPRFQFVFTATYPDGSEKEVGYYSVKAKWSLLRFFFKYVYGTVGPQSVFTVYSNDTRQAFEARLGRFFTAYTKELRKGGAAPETIRLSVARLGWMGNARGETHDVGVYDSSSKQFTHTWGRKAG